MSNENKKTTLPKLRFPEFGEVDEWEEKQLNEVATFLKGKGISKADVVPNGILPCIRYGELYTRYNERITSVISRTNLLAKNLVLSEKNDVIIPASGETQEDIATASCVLESGVALGGDLNIIRSDMNGVFLALYLSNVKKKDIAQLAQGIVVVHLYSNQLKKLSIYVPALPEQQKIAATLSSIDDLLTAQSAKLEALKAYKRGLMQGLFPAEGETVPKLRFPGFQDAEEWEEVTLEKLSQKISDGIHTTPKYDETGEYYFINGNNLVGGVIYVDEKTKRVSREEFKKYKKDLNENTVLISINGTIGNVSIYNNEKVILGKSACYINTNPAKLDKKYFVYLLQSDKTCNYFKSELTGSTIMNLSLKTIKNMVVNLPSMEEQQKIAACLSSLDNCITAQSQKIEALKLHKKGLMQHLFPAAAEPTA
jgi:type I restriction enzyme S subunit